MLSELERPHSRNSRVGKGGAGAASVRSNEKMTYNCQLLVPTWLGHQDDKR